MSENRNHRFTLTRNWMGSGKIVNFVMLNPSKADEVFDDPTIRKCCGFAKRWGYSRIIVTNLFAFRATDPKDLHALVKQGRMEYAIGYGNDEEIANAMHESDLHVMAWGANTSRYSERAADVRGMFVRTSCIGLTKDGHPVHPLMQRYTDAPILLKEVRND